MPFPDYELSETLDGTLDPDLLHAQLAARIGTPFRAITSTQDKGANYFSIKLGPDGTQAHQDECDAVIGDHRAEDAEFYADPADLKIFRYIDPDELRGLWPNKRKPPKGLNYKTGLSIRLEEKVSLVNGEVVQVDFYESADVNPDGNRVYNELVVRETHTYTRDFAGFALKRKILIEWIREDGSPSPTTKERPKTYSQRGSIREGKRRRSNIIDQLEIQVAQALLATEVVVPPTDPEFGPQMDAALQLGREFLKAHQSEVAVFVEGGHKSLRDEVVPAYDVESFQNAPAPWMENVDPVSGLTVRALILDALDI